MFDPVTSLWSCSQETASDCAAAGGNWAGAGSVCPVDHADCAVACPCTDPLQDLTLVVVNDAGDTGIQGTCVLTQNGLNTWQGTYISTDGSAENVAAYFQCNNGIFYLSLIHGAYAPSHQYVAVKSHAGVCNPQGTYVTNSTYPPGEPPVTITIS